MTDNYNIYKRMSGEREWGEVSDKSSETMVLSYTSIVRRERECEPWVRRGRDRKNRNGNQSSMVRMISMRGHMGHERGYQKGRVDV